MIFLLRLAWCLCIEWLNASSLTVEFCEMSEMSNRNHLSLLHLRIRTFSTLQHLENYVYIYHLSPSHFVQHDSPKGTIQNQQTPNWSKGFPQRKHPNTSKETKNSAKQNLVCSLHCSNCLLLNCPIFYSILYIVSTSFQQANSSHESCRKPKAWLIQ